MPSTPEVPPTQEHNHEQVNFSPEKRVAVANLTAQIRGCMDKIAQILVLDPVAPTRSAGRPRLSDEILQQRRSERIRAGVVRRLYRSYLHDVQLQPPDKPYDAVLAWAVKLRLVYEYENRPHIEPSEDRYQAVLAELRCVPQLALEHLTVNRVPVFLLDSVDLHKATRAAEENQARKELEAFMGPKERKAAEKAFTKRFGHVP